MVEQQLLARDITDPRVIDAIRRVPRDRFVPAPQRDAAYEDRPLPIGYRQTISQPYIVALMTDLAKVAAGSVVLEVGTGSGYQAAVLARLCRRLYTIERHPLLLEQAEDRLKRLGLVNITALTGDGTLGWPEQAPFERIVITAAAADVPEILLGQLAEGGIMVLPVGLDERDQHLIRVRRTENGAETEDLGATRFVPLIEAGVED